jgi:hypothetical protein
MWNCVQNVCCTAVTDSFFTNCRTHKLLSCGVAIFKPVTFSGGTQQQQQSPGTFETQLESFLWTGVAVKFYLFSVSFWKCEVLLCSLCIMFGMNNGPVGCCSSETQSHPFDMNNITASFESLVLFVVECYLWLFVNTELERCGRKRSCPVVRHDTRASQTFKACAPF